MIMKKESFDSKYGEKGGMSRLKMLNLMQFSRNYIAKYFGVTNSAVMQWNWIFRLNEELELPESIVIENMISFARGNSIDEFKFAFKRGKYYKQGLEKAKEEVYGK